MNAGSKIMRGGRIVSALLGMALLSACNGASAEPTPTPTLVPTLSTPPTVVVLPTPVIQAAPTAIPPAVQPTAPPPAAPKPVAPTSAPAAPAAATCVNKAANVRDVTIPDGTAVRAGATFTKTWCIHNGGTCAWSEAYSLAFNLGDRMDGPDGIHLPATPPGSDATVSIVLRAPLNRGSYKGFWKLRDASGHDFGTGPDNNIAFWVQIVVRR